MVYLYAKNKNGCVHVRNQFMCVRKPQSVDAKGMYDCMKRALAYLGRDSSLCKLVGKFLNVFL